MARISIPDLTALAAAALRASGAGDSAAHIAAKYLVAADSQGLATHGVARVATYCAHLRSGRVNRAAMPRVITDAGAACILDADTGLGFEPCELALSEAVASGAD